MIYTTRELADLYDVSIRTIQRRIASGEIDAEKVGRGFYEVPDEEPSRETEQTDEGAISTAEYAKKHGVTQRTVQRWIKEGKLSAYRVGRAYKIPEPPHDNPPTESDPDTVATAPNRPAPISEPIGRGGFEPDEDEEDEDEEECSEEISERDESSFSPESSRPHEYADCQDAINYRNDIPLPLEDLFIIRVKRGGQTFYRVYVEYEVVTTT